MSLDLAAAKRRSTIMIALSLIAGIAAAVGIYGYFKLHAVWALVAFLTAVVVGFGAQIWFIASLRGAKSASIGKGT